jgi:hypothetical protein
MSFLTFNLLRNQETLNAITVIFFIIAAMTSPVERTDLDGVFVI